MDDAERTRNMVVRRKATVIEVPTTESIRRADLHGAAEPHQPRRRLSGRVKQLERTTRLGREPLALAAGPSQAAAPSRGRDAPPLQSRAAARPRADPQLSFVTSARAASARAANQLRALERVHEIHVDNSSEDEVVARGQAPGPAAAGPAPPTTTTTTTTTTTGPAAAAARVGPAVSSTADKIEGFSSPYKPPQPRLATLAGLAAKSQAPRPLGSVRCEDLFQGVARSPTKIVDRLRPMTRVRTDAGAAAPQPGSGTADAQARLAELEAQIKLPDVDPDAFFGAPPLSSSPPKRSGPSLSPRSRAPTKSSPARQSRGAAAQQQQQQQRGANIPAKKLPLLGAKVGRHLEQGGGGGSSRLSVTIRYVQRVLEIGGLRDGNEYMRIDSSDIAALEHMVHEGLAVVRIAPVETIENIFGVAIFDPSSSSPDLRDIVLCLQLPQKGSDAPVSRLVAVLQDDIRVGALDARAFREYVHELTRPLSIDLISSSDDEGAAAKTRSEGAPVHAGADPWSSVGSLGRRVSEPGAGGSSSNKRRSPAAPPGADAVGGMALRKYKLQRTAADLVRDVLGSAGGRVGDSHSGIIDDDDDDDDDDPVQCREFRFNDHTLRFKYPRGATKPIAVTGSDISRLYRGEFLNDTILEFYIRYIREGLRASNPALHSQCFFFNTFFFRKLSQRGRSVLADPGSTPADAVHQQLKKWTASVDLFEKRYIFVPINENTHWYLAIIANSKLLLPGSGSDGSSEQPLPPAEEPAAAAPAPSDTDTEMTDASRAVEAVERAMAGPEPSAGRDDAGPGAPPTESSPSQLDSAQPDSAQPDSAQPDSAHAQPDSAQPDSAQPDSAQPDSSQPAAAAEQPKPGGAKGAMVAVSFMGETREIREASYMDPLGTPAIVILDSLGGRHQPTFRLLRNYIRAEAGWRHGVEVADEAQVGKYAKVPLQNNLCDCGVFLLQYIEEFLKDPAGFMAMVLGGVSMRAMFTSHQMKQKRMDILGLATSLAEEHTRQQPAPDAAASGPDGADGEPDDAEASVVLYPTEPPAPKADAGADADTDADADMAAPDTVMPAAKATTEATTTSR
ncbi:hypothetical protein H4R18_002304 [Coemansia javaensis]|uniref:Ubiquitin-like protease family profile domain-containing protein n=1 Tax=Coemansia javaensis TaxID=2761396 RepID=A0A9W8LJB8_9FUNG|nr:hypothetical protein H4R18_002304 [Coemansia javaensis]